MTTTWQTRRAVCDVDGCPNTAIKRHMCNNHYMQAWRRNEIDSHPSQRTKNNRPPSTWQPEWGNHNDPTDGGYGTVWYWRCSICGVRSLCSFATPELAEPYQQAHEALCDRPDPAKVAAYTAIIRNRHQRAAVVTVSAATVQRRTDRLMALAEQAELFEAQAELIEAVKEIGEAQAAKRAAEMLHRDAQADYDDAAIEAAWPLPDRFCVHANKTYLRVDVDHERPYTAAEKAEWIAREVAKDPAVKNAADTVKVAAMRLDETKDRVALAERMFSARKHLHDSAVCLTNLLAVAFTLGDETTPVHTTNNNGGDQQHA